MECLVCTVRSSTAYCTTCKVLLCDECGSRCEVCNKAYCPTHARRVHGGRVVCEGCSSGASVAAVKQGRGLFNDDAAFVPLGVMTNIEAQNRERERVKRGEGTLRPWKLSLYLALAGLGMALLLLVFPALRTVSIGSASRLLTAYFAIIPPLLGAGIGVAGFFEPLPRESRGFNCIGIAVAAVAIGLSIVSVVNVPPRPDAVQAERSRPEPKESMFPERPQRERSKRDWTPDEWRHQRRNVLERYKH